MALFDTVPAISSSQVSTTDILRYIYSTEEIILRFQPNSVNFEHSGPFDLP